MRGTGTFHETWILRWRPELAVEIIDAAALGHDGGVRRHREDRVRRVAGRAAGGYHPSGRAGTAGRPVRGARTGAARPRRLGRDRVRRHPADGRRPGPGARDPVRRRARHRHRRALGRGGRAHRPGLRRAARRRRRPGRRRRLGAAGVARRHARGARTARARGARRARPRPLDDGPVRARRATRRARPGCRAGGAAAGRRRGAVIAGGRPTGSRPRCRSASRRPTRRSGRRGSCPAAACCSPTTGICSASSTAGWRPCRSRSSWTCCRCCGGRSASSRSPSGRASAGPPGTSGRRQSPSRRRRLGRRGRRRGRRGRDRRRAGGGRTADRRHDPGGHIGRGSMSDAGPGRLPRTARCAVGAKPGGIDG